MPQLQTADSAHSPAWRRLQAYFQKAEAGFPEKIPPCFFFFYITY
jgi:hypothetical protein